MTERLIFSTNSKSCDLRYNRSSSNIQYRLEQELSTIYDGKKVCVCNSGMNSLDGLLHAIFIKHHFS